MIKLALTYGAVASTGAAAWVGWGQGQAQLAGAVALAALLFVAVRLWLVGGVRLGARLPRRDTIASVALVGLLVTAGVAGPMAQPVQAAEAGNCSDLDDFVMFATLGLVNSEDCSREAYVQDAIADYEQTDAEQTKVDIYSEGESISQGADNYLVTNENYLNDTETVAWSKMQVAVAEAYQNGSTQSQARLKAEQAIEDYYAVKQRNLIAQHNSHVSTLHRLSEQAQMEDNVSSGYVHAESTLYDPGSGGSADILRTETQNITLVNGSTVESVYLIADEGSGEEAAAKLTDQGGYSEPHGIQIDPPTESFNETTVYKSDRYISLWTQTQSKSASLVSEAKTFVDATYSDFDSGDVNASDVISANTAMFEYGTRSGSENETLYNSVGALALMGFDTPSINSSGTMDVTYENTTYQGIVMARNAPNGSWEANTTYDPANITGPVFVVTTGGKKIDLTSPFTIGEVRAKDGSDLQSVNTTRYSYKTANATELMEMQSRLSSLRQEIEERQPSGGGGGIGGIGDSKAIIAIIAGVAVLLLTRD